MQLIQHIDDHVSFYFEEGKSETAILQLGGFFHDNSKQSNDGELAS